MLNQALGTGFGIAGNDRAIAWKSTDLTATPAIHEDRHPCEGGPRVKPAQLLHRNKNWYSGPPDGPAQKTTKNTWPRQPRFDLSFYAIPSNPRDPPANAADGEMVWRKQVIPPSIPANDLEVNVGPQLCGDVLAGGGKTFPNYQREQHRVRCMRIGPPVDLQANGMPQGQQFFASFESGVDRVFKRGQLAGMFIEKLRNLLHDQITIFIRNAKPALRTYLLENSKHFSTMEQAEEYAEQWKTAIEAKGITTAKVAEITMGAEKLQLKQEVAELKQLIADEEDVEDRQREHGQVEAFGRNTGTRSQRGGSTWKGGSPFTSTTRTPQFQARRAATARGPGSGNQVVMSAGNVKYGPPRGGGGRMQDANKCYGCGSQEHYIRNCPLLAQGRQMQRGRGRGAGQRSGRFVRIRRRPQIAAVAEEYEDVWIEDDDGTQQIGEEQQDQAVDPAVAAVNILARGEVSGGRIDHVTC